MQITDFQLNAQLQELTKHHTVTLPVACYETTIQANVHGYIPLHWHEELQWIVVLQGSAQFQVNEEYMTVSKGEGLFINQAQLHGAKDDAKNSCIYRCLNVSPLFIMSNELYAAYVQPYLQANSYMRLTKSTSWSNQVLAHLQAIYTLLETKHPLFEFDLTIHLTQLWKEMIIGFQQGIALRQPIQNERMKQMLQWIHTHYAETIILENIAQAGQLSRSECCRYFKRILHTTPLQYVTDYRIRKSLTYLQQYNVTEVAYEVGFNSTSYYIEKFKERMGQTPLAYKKSIANKDEMEA